MANMQRCIDGLAWVIVDWGDPSNDKLKMFICCSPLASHLSMVPMHISLDFLFAVCLHCIMLSFSFFSHTHNPPLFHAIIAAHPTLSTSRAAHPRVTLCLFCATVLCVFSTIFAHPLTRQWDHASYSVSAHLCLSLSMAHIIFIDRDHRLKKCLIVTVPRHRV